jgi:hypothetical protein
VNARRTNSGDRRWIAGALLLLAGCSGDIRPAGDDAPGGDSASDNARAGADPGGPGSGGSGAPGNVPPGANPGGLTTPCDDGAEPGPTPLLKLTTTQYRNTVRDLLDALGAGSLTGALLPLLARVPDDSLGDSFRALDDRISLELLQAYFDVGVAFGDALETDAELRADVAGECATAATLAAGCLRDFVERFGMLSYRRPLTDAEVDALTALDDGSRTPAEVIRAVVVVAMSSPRFVNHVEIDGASIGAAGGASGGSATGQELLQLTGYEIASRLSYLFWGTMPDAELFAAAADGSLATEAGFTTQLMRVFADDRTRDTLWQFWNEWLRLERFTGFETSRPGFESLVDGELPSDTLYDDMVQEVRDLTELFSFERTATLSELLSTRESVTRGAELAALYGVAPAPPGSAPSYPSFPDGTRAGLLQRGALLVSNLETTNPFHRGALVRRNLLCDPLPQPDPNSLPPGSLDPPPITSDQTTRERFEAKIAGNATCAACHDGFASIGYALESFDALGRHRALERVFDEQTGELLAELPLDTSGVPRIVAGDTTPVMGAAELNQRIVDSKKVERCLSSKYFAFALRRLPAGQSLDACVVDDLAAALDDPAAGLGDALARIARHASFFQKKVGPP